MNLRDSKAAPSRLKSAEIAAALCFLAIALVSGRAFAQGSAAADATATAERNRGLDLMRQGAIPTRPSKPSSIRFPSSRAPIRASTSVARALQRAGSRRVFTNSIARATRRVHVSTQDSRSTPERTAQPKPKATHCARVLRSSPFDSRKLRRPEAKWSWAPRTFPRSH